MVVVMEHWRYWARMTSLVSAGLAAIILVANAQQALATLSAVRPAFIFDIGWLADTINARLDILQRRNDVENLQNQSGIKQTQELIASNHLVQVQLMLRMLPDDPLLLLDQRQTLDQIASLQHDIQTDMCQIRVANGEPVVCPY